MQEQGKNEKSFNEILSILVSMPGLRKIYIKAKLKSAWEKTMGPTILKYTQKFVFKNGIFTVYIQNASLKNDLHLGRSKILEKMNSEIQSDLIKEVKIL